MFILFSVLILIVAIALIIAVLVQDSKGGGLSSTFAASNQVMGVRKTADFLEKATWVLVGALLVLSVAASATVGEKEATEGSVIQEQVKDVPAPGTPMNLPPAGN